MNVVEVQHPNRIGHKLQKIKSYDSSYNFLGHFAIGILRKQKDRIIQIPINVLTSGLLNAIKCFPLFHETTNTIQPSLDDLSTYRFQHTLTHSAIRNFVLDFEIFPSLVSAFITIIPYVALFPNVVTSIATPRIPAREKLTRKIAYSVIFSRSFFSLSSHKTFITFTLIRWTTSEKIRIQ